MKLLISPHDDDQCLFCAYTCIREKPLVLVVLDSYIQPLRGEVGCSASERAKETAASCRVMDCPVVRLGLRDDEVQEHEIFQRFEQLRFLNCETVYAPAYHENGNPHHNTIALIAKRIWPDCKTYPSYSRTELYKTGTEEIIPTPEETKIKNKALECHQSQLRINGPHFDAVIGKSEWLN